MLECRRQSEKWKNVCPKVTKTTVKRKTSTPAATTKPTALFSSSDCKMVKMEFLKRKHFSLWIITAFVLVTGLVDGTAGLQGVPTWICLGLKSPFIEFSSELELLANTSVPLNITKDEQALMHQEGLRKLGTFIKPIDLRDSTTGFVKANLTKKIPSTSLYGTQIQRRLHPIQEEMDQKQIILLDEDTDENGLPASLTDEDRKFIVPMALKNASPDPRIPTTTTQRTTTTTRATTTTTKGTTPATPDFASNIDDLKKHILFLQNLTKHDSNFQSKFVVFPSLHKDKQKPDIFTTTIRPQRAIFQYSAPVPPPTRKIPLGVKVSQSGQTFGGYYHNEEDESMSVFMSPPGTNAREKITIVPQVLLLNDQTSERAKNDPGKDGALKRRNMAKTGSGASTTTPITTTTTEVPTTVRTTPRKPTKKPPCLRNPESPKCLRQRKREELQRQRDREQLLREQREYLLPRYEPFIQTINNTKRFAVSIEIPDSFKNAQQRQNETEDQLTAPIVSLVAPVNSQQEELLSRPARSHHKRRNIGGGLQGRSGTTDKFAAKYGGSAYFERESVMSSSGGIGAGTGARDFLISSVDQFGTLLPNSSTPSPTVAAYSEPIDLNPDNCYHVDGMTYGQKKHCVLHTSVMPAISRGARAAIQECQYQFKNRRWNCSTNEDNTVFGPMTALGSPEMAFIHALAAATVTSFIARACRDGQLASCGCSRGSRPKQLHDDWTWGGCGDNLEYAYKFATDFIDIREKETKRGTRGAGSPERKRGRLHQRRNQQMQADDSAAVTSTNVTLTSTTTMKTILANNSNNSSSSIIATNENINDNHQRGSNKTVSSEANTDSSKLITPTQSSASSKDTTLKSSSVAPPRQEDSSEEDNAGRIKPEDLLELQERITKEILNSKLQEKEMLELQEKINREILNSKVFNMEGSKRKKKRKNQRAVNGLGGAPLGPLDAGYNANMGGPAAGGGASGGKWKNGISAKARSLMNLHNNEAGRRAVIKKTRITCKCHGVSGSCSLITCWQQLSSIREIGDYLREKYEESTEVKLNKRGRLQVKDPQFKVPTAHDLVYLDESPDWCRNNRQLQWPGTHGRICNKSSSGLDGCGILCCGRGYNTKNIVVRERCNCKFHWCCQVKCDVCVKVLEEHTCK